MIDTNDGFIQDNPTIIEGVANEGQNIMQQPIVSGISDDHLEEHQIYSSKKELQRKLYMMALKRKLSSKQLNPLLSYCLLNVLIKNASGEFVLPSWGFPICFK